MRFGDVVGQQVAKQYFVNSVATGRLGHAMLLQGIGGVGKLPFIWAATQFLLCQQRTATDSCGVCTSCRKVSQLIHPDVHLVVPYIVASDKAQGKEDHLIQLRQQLLQQPYLSLADWGGSQQADNKQLVIPIQPIRELGRRLQLTSYEGGIKVVMLWHAEKINPEAANAFLKLLEEPPKLTYLFLTLEEPARLLPTLQSRCQTVRLGRLSTQELSTYLVEHTDCEPAQALELATLADGSLGTAVHLTTSTTNPLAEQIPGWLRSCYEGNFEVLQNLAETMSQEPREAQKLFLQLGLQKLREALMIKAEAVQLIHSLEAEKQFLVRFGKTLSLPAFSAAADALEAASYALSRNANQLLVWLNLNLALHRCLRQQAA